MENKELGKQLRKKRNIYFLLHIFTSKILALIIFIVKFDLIGPPKEGVSKSYRIRIFLIIGLVWFVVDFWSIVSGFIRDMQEGLFREILHSLNTLFLPLLFWGSGVLAHYFISGYLFFTGTLLVTSMLGIVFKAFYNYYRRKDLLNRGYVNVITK